MRRSIRFLIANGIFSFFLGRLLPKRFFDPNSALFRPKAFEKNGAFYDRFFIRFWHKRVPDMSRIFPRLMPKKALEKGSLNQLEIMVRETCVAEFIHLLLFFASFAVFAHAPNASGVLVFSVYNLVFNLPYLMIQRYNRPRLMRLSCQIQKRNAQKDLCATLCT